MTLDLGWTLRWLPFEDAEKCFWVQWHWEVKHPDHGQEVIVEELCRRRTASPWTARRRSRAPVICRGACASGGGDSSVAVRSSSARSVTS